MARAKKEVETKTETVQTFAVTKDVKLISLNIGSVSGVIYPKNLKLFCEFDGTPELDRLEVKCPVGWKQVGASELIEDKKVLLYFAPPKKADKTCKFEAIYDNDTENKKELTVPVILADNSLVSITTDKEFYLQDETATIILKYSDKIDFERDKPFQEQLADGIVKATGPVLEDNVIKYTVTFTKTGDLDFTVSCFQSKAWQTSRKVAVKVVPKAPYEEVTYALNGKNFTSVGDTFLSLCKPKIIIKSTDIKLIKAAEEQVKLGVLKKL